MTAQLSYQPALDPYHSAYRIFRLFEIIRRAGRLPIDKVRLIDFYLLFPFRLDEIRVKREHRRYKSLAKKYHHKRPYGDMPEDKTLFYRMSPMHEAAFETLANSGFLSMSALNSGWAEPLTDVPAGLRTRIEAANQDDKDLLEFLEILIVDYDLAGADGLKSRTGLLEHRYDAI